MEGYGLPPGLLAGLHLLKLHLLCMPLICYLHTVSQWLKHRSFHHVHVQSYLQPGLSLYHCTITLHHSECAAEWHVLLPPPTYIDKSFSRTRLALSTSFLKRGPCIKGLTNTFFLQTYNSSSVLTDWNTLCIPDLQHLAGIKGLVHLSHLQPPTTCQHPGLNSFFLHPRSQYIQAVRL